MATQSFDSTLGAAFVGFAVAAVLYGVLLAQLYTYFQRYTQDRLFYKCLVVFVCILETIHSALSGHVVYHYAISSFSDPLALLVPTWTLIAQVLVGGFAPKQAYISVLVKSAFAMRVWRFSHKNVVLTGSILALNAAILVLAVIFTVKAISLPTFADQPKLKGITTAILTTSVFTDILIAASLTYYLHHLRNAFSATTLINGLIAYSIETGAITSICGIATLVSFDTLPLTFVYIGFFFVLSKLYSNSLLATLNTRRVVRGRGTDRSPGTNGEFTIIQSSGQVQTTHSIFGQIDWSKQPSDIEVNVLREVVTTPSGSEFSAKHSRGKGSVDSYDMPYVPNQLVSQRVAYSRPPPEYVTTMGRSGLRAPERVARF
ncbi:uncharacterized protein FOMMEDRAFT_161031 [Fomitiporia mediterranea MF3/22]|uniref:uncharacterized protein n=1 Tax=Fomitiporia mediterranea (strain MF3/22) TaxID=694068 RepID=UPI0004408586|nr:uncharacterized protein FOMMEDRAFT_161031 [Fomitiporia mediterranea MF3/22]EJC98851.1 hypothetical protein FOMMEDRAFT_161031 [Fomitiporia mediterranea MF3/22]